MSRAGQARRASAGRRRWPTEHYLLVACLVGVVVVFMSSIVVTVLRMRAASLFAEDVTTKTVPGLEHLAMVRAHLQTLGSLAEEANVGHPWVPGSFRRLRDLVGDEWALYRRGTRTDLPSVVRADLALREADSSFSEMRSQLSSGADTAANVESVHLAVSNADEALERLVVQDMNDLERTLRRAQDERRHDVRVALFWNATSLILAIAFALLAIASVRRHTALLEAKAAELEQFGDRVAHDLRGPLTPVMFALEMAEAAVKDDDRVRRAVERGVRSARVIDDLVSALFAFARSGAKSSPDDAANVRSTIDDVVSELGPLAEQAQVTLKIEPFDDCAVACRRGALASVLGNLVRNAIVHLGDSKEPRVEIRIKPAKDVRIEVNDSGPGIPPELVNVIFEPRVQGPKATSGLGIGLATVRRLVQACGGSVGVRSERGCGSTFWVVLPRAKSQPGASKTVPDVPSNG